MGDTANKTIDAIAEIKTKVVAFLTDYGFQLVGALIMLAIGMVVAWWVGRALGRWLEKKKVEPPIVMLAVRVVRLLIFIVVLLAALEKLGVPTTSALAGIGVVVSASGWPCSTSSATPSPDSPSFSPSRSRSANGSRLAACPVR
jgi:small conductance mechanosensitive channel